MELLYRNEYGATYKVVNSANPACVVQLIVDSVGLYLSKNDLDYLMNIVLKSNEPCSCDDCGGNKCN
ncbi:hypothetical protein [Aurantibacter sp.]|uniref:hypothetical protein n=1 Tax=Aurantibacter sp. TaxID=2807103 RepID=UPI003263DA82